VSEVGLPQAARGTCTPAKGSISAPRRRARGYPRRSSSAIARHFGRRCADRAGCRHHRHRRPAETEKALSLPSAMGLPATGVGSPRPRGRKPKRARGSPG
jgi:hypothetical protein